ncbi:MAG: hypothetical protein ABIO70_17605 [Pseudomonadota bacterium]
MKSNSMNRSGSQVLGGQRVVILDLVEDSHEVTMGAGGYKWRPVSDILVDVGPRMEGLTCHYKLADATANFKFQLRGTWSVDGMNWETFSSDLMIEATSDSQVVETEYTTKTDFGRRIRFELGTSDTGTVQHGVVTIAVAQRFYQGA